MTPIHRYVFVVLLMALCFSAHVSFADPITGSGQMGCGEGSNCQGNGDGITPVGSGYNGSANGADPGGTEYRGTNSNLPTDLYRGSANAHTQGGPDPDGYRGSANGEDPGGSEYRGGNSPLTWIPGR